MSPPLFECVLLDLEGTLAAPDRQTGRAALLPGVAQTLETFHSGGVSLGIASNCGQGYLDGALKSLDLSRWVREARCLASSGIQNKADMIADLLAVFDTRSAVMVGDTRGDRDSAWANGVPFVDVGGAFRQWGDRLEAEGSIERFDGLVEVLAARRRVLNAVLGITSLESDIVVEGMPLAGKTLLARDLERAGARRVFDDPNHVADGVVRVHLVCDEDVLVRRAKGLRRGVGPVEALIYDRLPAYDPTTAGRADVVVDMSNPIEPQIR